MSGYSNFNVVYRLQKWMDSVPGQTFLNYAYSWGASIVILGTLFKLTHLPGANVALFLGMGTEVLVFFLSAFDRPFDKTADGRDIPTHVTEEYLETGRVVYDESSEATERNDEQPIVVAAPVQAAQPVSGVTVQSVATPKVEPAQSVANPAQPVANSAQAVVTTMETVSPEMVEAQNNYVEELKKLVETLEKVNEQSTRLTRDSEEMENLNRTLTGISKVYEMQLKGASQQIGTIDQINEQSRKMAQQIEQLNKIYTRMIEAMTVNMRAATPGVAKTEE